jgi:hypothetical protein
MSLVKPQFTDLLRRQLNRRVELKAIGNSNRKMKDVAIDLINESHLDYETIAAGCFLSETTIKRLALEITINPQSETIERIFRYFQMTVNLKGEIIKPQFINIEKEK